MAVTIKPQSRVMTANADALTEDVIIDSITFQGTGLTAGQILTLVDSGSSVIVDWVVPDTIANADLWAGRTPRKYKNPTLTGPAAGTWKLTIGITL